MSKPTSDSHPDMEQTNPNSMTIAEAIAEADGAERVSQRTVRRVVINVLHSQNNVTGVIAVDPDNQ